MKPPKSGCITLEHLRHYGYQMAGTKNAGVDEVFEHTREAMEARNVMTFYLPVCPVKEGDRMEYMSIRPPYSRCWIETVDPDDGPMGFAVDSGPAEESECIFVRILAFWLERGNCKPTGMAAVQYTLDKAGKRMPRTGISPMYGEPGDDENAKLQDSIVYPCVRILQRMNVTNIGFYQEHDPDENNPRLTRAQRRKLIGRRYHVLVIRETRDIKAGRKVVDYKGVMPLHWARGHYQHYGPASVHGHPDGRDRGLAFGWLAGVFYIEEVAKGDAKNGIVDKGYRLTDSSRSQRKRRNGQPVENQAADDAAYTAATSPLNRDQPAAPATSLCESQSENDQFATATTPTNRDIQQPQD